MYSNITAIKAANKSYAEKTNRAYWFALDTMRFFATKLYSKVYKGRYFITSEQFISDHGNGPRLYSVRECMPNGSIETVGKFQAYNSLAEAKRAIQLLPFD